MEGSNITNKIQRAFSFFFLNKKKYIVEIKTLYRILILYVHKIILVTKLKGRICRVWLATPEAHNTQRLKRRRQQEDPGQHTFVPGRGSLRLLCDQHPPVLWFAGFHILRGNSAAGKVTRTCKNDIKNAISDRHMGRHEGPASPACARS